MAAVLSRLNRYALAPDTTALIHITNINGNELHVADVWQLQGDSPDLSVFKAEIDAAAKVLTPPWRLQAQGGLHRGYLPWAKTHAPELRHAASDRELNVAGGGAAAQPAAARARGSGIDRILALRLSRCVRLVLSTNLSGAVRGPPVRIARDDLSKLI